MPSWQRLVMQRVELAEILLVLLVAKKALMCSTGTFIPRKFTSKGHSKLKIPNKAICIHSPSGSWESTRHTLEPDALEQTEPKHTAFTPCSLCIFGEHIRLPFLGHVTTTCVAGAKVPVVYIVRKPAAAGKQNADVPSFLTYQLIMDQNWLISFGRWSFYPWRLLLTTESDEFWCILWVKPVHALSWAQCRRIMQTVGCPCKKI